MRRFAWALISFVSLLAALACTAENTAEVCKGIPAGGCPLSHGVACEDPSCRAVYACLPDQEWELREVCPPAPETDASTDAAPDATEAGTRRDAGLVLPPGASGGPGCEDLQAPDCSLALAASCSTGCCGCDDVFVCSNGGWLAWGYCAEDGSLVSNADSGVTPP